MKVWACQTMGGERAERHLCYYNNVDIGVYLS